MDDYAGSGQYEERHPADGCGPQNESWTDAPSDDNSAASFQDQLLRGSWPIRMPMSLEIYADGSMPQVHSLKPGGHDDIPTVTSSQSCSNSIALACAS